MSGSNNGSAPHTPTTPYFLAEKKTCFVLSDGGIEYPGAHEAAEASSAVQSAPPSPSSASSVHHKQHKGGDTASQHDYSSDNEAEIVRLRSPPPQSAASDWAEWHDPSSIPRAVSEWKSEPSLRRAHSTSSFDRETHSDADSESASRPSSKGTSLRALGRSPTPPNIRKRKRKETDHTQKRAKVVLSEELLVQKFSQQQRYLIERGEDLEHPCEEAWCAHPGGHPTPSHFLRLPAEVLTPILGFCSFREVVAVQQTCVALRSITPSSIESLDLTTAVLNSSLSVLLTRLSLQGMRLKCFSLPATLTERYSGVMGFVLRNSPHVHTIEFSGAPPHLHTVQDVIRHCPSLKEFLQIRHPVPNEPSFFPLSTEFSSLEGSLRMVLDASKGILSVTIGAMMLTDDQKKDQSGVATLQQTGLRIPKKIDSFIHSASLRKLRIDRAVAGALRTSACDLPNLLSLCLIEDPTSAGHIPFALTDVLDVTGRSPLLQELTLSACFCWSIPDVKTLQICCPNLSRIRLKSGAGGTERWDAMTPTSQISPLAFNAFFDSFEGLREFHVEAAGWDPHWTSYHDVIGTDALVLQTQLSLLETPLTRHLRSKPSLGTLSAVILYGDITNFLVSEVLSSCPHLARLELYLLPPSSVDDDMFTIEVVPSLSWLHVHDATLGKGLGKSLTKNAFRGLRSRFPNLKRLGVCGVEAEGVMDVMALEGLPSGLTWLTLGPVLKTSAELLLLLKAVGGLETLELAWHGGQLPLRDEEFPSALGLETLSRIVSEINPKVTLRDVGSGHFNLLF